MWLIASFCFVHSTFLCKEAFDWPKQPRLEMLAHVTAHMWTLGSLAENTPSNNALHRSLHQPLFASQS
jgi:hypothetical protein